MYRYTAVNTADGKGFTCEEVNECLSVTTSMVGRCKLNSVDP